MSLFFSSFIQFAKCNVCCLLLAIYAFGSTTSSVALAEEPPRYTLENNQWAQLTIPGNSSNYTIEQLFSNVLSAQEYGVLWQIFLFDAENNSYLDPGINGVIPQGAGFWMFQKTGGSVTLELPDNFPQADGKTSSACSNNNVCTESTLIASATNSNFNMIGSALQSDIAAGNVRIQTETGDCSNGCSWDEAVELNIVSNRLWHYDSDSGSYVDLAETGFVGAWQGMWVQIPRARQTNVVVLFPADSTRLSCESASGFAGDDGLKRWCWSDLAAEINQLRDQTFIDNDKLFTSVHHYPDSAPEYLPVEVVGDQLVFTVTPRNPLNTSNPPVSGEQSAWNYRSEVRDAPSNVDHPNGTEQWWGFNYTFGDDYIIDDLPWIFWQTHLNKSFPRSPMHSLTVSPANYGGAGNVRGEIVVSNNVYNSTTGSTRLKTGVIPQAGQTLKVVIQLIWGTDETGLLRIWLDDELVYNAQERTSYTEHEVGGYWKAGIYKWRWQNESNIEISEALGISRLQTSIGTLRVIKNDPDDSAYLTDQYAVVDPAQDSEDGD